MLLNRRYSATYTPTMKWNSFYPSGIVYTTRHATAAVPWPKMGYIAAYETIYTSTAPTPVPSMVPAVSDTVGQWVWYPLPMALSGAVDGNGAVAVSCKRALILPCWLTRVHGILNTSFCRELKNPKNLHSNYVTIAKCLEYLYLPPHSNSSTTVLFSAATKNSINIFSFST